MKRLPFVAILVLALPATAAPRGYSAAVQQALLNALGNERQAAVRYDACAAKAAEEGYAGAAALFRAAAKAERIHAARFEAALKRGLVAIPAASPATVEVGTTGDNLKDSAAAETSERDGTYRDAVDAAHDARDTAIAKLFDVTRDAETEHGNLCANAARQLDQMKQRHHYYVCTSCGYVTDFPMGMCPSCRAQHALVDVQ